jgi:hypothetical protein
VLELAVHADHVDVAPPRGPGDQFQRPLLTTVDDLVESSRLVDGGPRPLTKSILMSGLAVSDAGSIRADEEAICARAGLPWRALDDCPYVLLGEPERIAEQVRERQDRIGLDWLIVPDAAAVRFASEVMPLL